MKQKIEILQLSVRSTNCLKQERIDYIDDLVVLHKLDLKRIPNMGEKSINEIKEQLAKRGLSLGMEACHNIDDESLYVKEGSEINIWLDSIANIEFKQAKLNNFLLNFLNNLTVRSRNALNAELILHNNIIEFLKYLFSLQSILVLPNVGRASEFEIQKFLTNIHQEIKYLYQSEKITINTTFNTTLDLMEYMNIPQHLIDKYVENNLDNNIRFFAIINLVIKNNLSKKELEILKHRKNYWNEEQNTLEYLGNKLGVTRERIRQIEAKANKKLWLTIKGLSAYTVINIEQQYEFYNDFISDVSVINKRDKTNFSNDFLYRILSIFLQNNYQLLINNKNVCKFLIKKSLANVFNFEGFIDKISFLIQGANIDYKLDFKGMLYPYFKSINRDINMIEIESICEELLNLEFDMVPDIDNQILIKSKRNKSIDTYAEEVLKSANSPMHLDEIYRKIKENYTEFYGSKRYIGNAFAGNDKFIFFDRNSTYGLKFWEGKLTQNSKVVDIVRPNKTNNNRSGIKVWSGNGKIIVKGGSMIDIVIEYLKKFKTPQHIDDIFYEVAKWRDTSKHKLLSNLKVNNKGYFVFYKNGLIGLSNE